jgi:hypothetical protein
MAKEEIKKTDSQKKFLVHNRQNAPHEFRIKNQEYRLEPRDKDGHSVVLDESSIKTEDFQQQIKNGYISYQEVK